MLINAFFVISILLFVCVFRNFINNHNFIKKIITKNNSKMVMKRLFITK